MAKKEDTNVEETVAELKKQMTEFAAWRRKVSANWKRFVQTGAVGPACLKKGSDGELAFSRPLVLSAVFVLIVGIAIAGNVSQIGGSSPDRAHYDTLAIRNDGSIVSGATGTILPGATISNLVATLGGTTVTVTNDLAVSKNATISGTLGVTGTQTFQGATTIRNLTVSTNAVVTGTLNNQGATTLNNLTVNTNATVSGALTVTGKTTANGELEVNQATVDINLKAVGDVITVDQTNAVGTSATPLIAVVDARTGANANSAGEATLMITPSGTHAISVTAGISALQAVEATTITASGTQDFVGATTVNNLTVDTNATVSGILTIVGIPAVNTPLGTPGTNVLLTTTGPDNSVAAPMWIPATHNGTNIWFAVWPRN